MRCIRCGNEFPYDGRPCCPCCGRAFTPQEIAGGTGMPPRRKKKHTFLKILLVLFIISTVFWGTVCLVLFNMLFPSSPGGGKDTQIAAEAVSWTFTTPLRQQLGGSYTPDENDFRFTDGGKQFGYVDHMILVVFRSGVSDSEVQRVAALAGGEPVGCIDRLDEFQFRVSASGEDALKALCKQIQRESSVILAMPDRVVAESYDASADFGLQDVVPEDPWNTYPDNIFGKIADFFANFPIKWSMVHQGGNNWYQEIIGAPSAWAYSDYCGRISIGIIDGAFDTAHNDLQITVLHSDLNTAAINAANRLLNPDQDSKRGLNHGTHVSGIIGARRGNGIGINGILSCRYSLYGFPKFNATYRTGNHLLTMYDELLAQGCRIITRSMGPEWKHTDANGNTVRDIENGVPVDQTTRQPYSADEWHDEGIDSANIILTLLEKRGSAGYPTGFLLVNSAGNSGIDALYNCGICSVTPAVASEAASAWEGGSFSGQDIMDSIIVVGAVERNESYGHYKIKASGISLDPLYLLVTERNDDLQLTDFSNYGSQVTIAAPGSHIFSTISNDSYGEMSGTSQAAPIVAACAAQVWSLDLNMSAGQVKHILTSAAVGNVQAYQAADSRTYGMVNLKDAVEKTLMDRGRINEKRPDGDLKKLVQNVLTDWEEHGLKEAEEMAEPLPGYLENGKIGKFLSTGFQIGLKLFKVLPVLLLHLFSLFWIEV